MPYVLLLGSSQTFVVRRMFFFSRKISLHAELISCRLRGGHRRRQHTIRDVMPRAFPARCFERTSFSQPNRQRKLCMKHNEGWRRNERQRQRLVCLRGGWYLPLYYICRISDWLNNQLTKYGIMIFFQPTQRQPLWHSSLNFIFLFPICYSDWRSLGFADEIFINSIIILSFCLIRKLNYTPTHTLESSRGRFAQDRTIIVAGSMVKPSQIFIISSNVHWTLEYYFVVP